MDNTLLFVNEVLGVEGVEVADNKVTMTIEQLTAMNTAIQTRNETVATLTAEKQTAIDAKATAETALNDVTAKVETLTAELAKRPGVVPAAPAGNNGGDSATDQVDQATIDALPHNQAADREI